jgi:hypothetical protein
LPSTTSLSSWRRRRRRLQRRWQRKAHVRQIEDKEDGGSQLERGRQEAASEKLISLLDENKNHLLLSIGSGKLSLNKWFQCRELTSVFLASIKPQRRRIF